MNITPIDVTVDPNKSEVAMSNNLYPTLVVCALLSFSVVSCDSYSGIEADDESADLVLSKTAGATTHQLADLYLFYGSSPVGGGEAKLIRTADGVKTTVKAVDLTPNATYTLWWMIYNNPEACQNPVAGVSNCGEPDLGIPDVNATILHASGHVVGQDGVGNFAASLAAGDVSGCVPPFGDFGLCGGLTDVEGAEVHVALHSHGEIVPGLVHEQLSTFAGACTPETSFGAGDGPNECVTQQYAAFLPE